MPLPAIITYDGLPLSSGGGHILRTNRPSIALRQVREFIELCTDASEPLERAIEVLSGEGVPSPFSDLLVEKFRSEFGIPRARLVGKNRSHIWPVSLLDLDKLVASIERLCPLPAHPHKLQPVAATLVFQFQLLDRQTRTPLTHRGAINDTKHSPSSGHVLGESHLYARISERSSVSVFLSFPFEDVTAAFLDSAAFVQEHLPFALSGRHWKRWHLSRNGATYVGRKITVPRIRA